MIPRITIIALCLTLSGCGLFSKKEAEQSFDGFFWTLAKDGRLALCMPGGTMCSAPPVGVWERSIKDYQIGRSH